MPEMSLLGPTIASRFASPVGPREEGGYFPPLVSITSKNKSLERVHGTPGRFTVKQGQIVQVVVSPEMNPDMEVFMTYVPDGGAGAATISNKYGQFFCQINPEIESRTPGRYQLTLGPGENTVVFHSDGEVTMSQIEVPGIGKYK